MSRPSAIPQLTDEQRDDCYGRPPGGQIIDSTGGQRPLPPAPPSPLTARLDLVAHIARQRAFSLRTFGPGERTAGVINHIRKELVEIEQSPGDLEEWIDVILLAQDGAWRQGYEPQEIAAALAAKQTKNEARDWPDWRTADPTKAIEHVRDTACTTTEGMDSLSETLRPVALDQCADVNADQPGPGGVESAPGPSDLPALCAEGTCAVRAWIEQLRSRRWRFPIDSKTPRPCRRCGNTGQRGQSHIGQAGK